MQKHRQQVKPSVSGTTPLETKDVANLDEVFGKELQAFYRHAIEQHCLKSSYYCTYALENIHKVYISRMEFIRGTVVDDENVPVTKWGTGLPGLSFLGPNDNDHTSFPKFEDIRSSLEKCFNMNESTVRVWMDIECTGKFPSK